MHDDINVRLRAVKGLGRISDKRVVEALTVVIKDEALD